MSEAGRPQKDTLVRALVGNGEYRAVLSVTTELVGILQRRHGLDPLVTIALGRAVNCAALLASNLKQRDEYLHLSLGGSGPMRGLVAECNGTGGCRGYAYEPRLVEVMKTDQAVPQTVSAALGRAGLVTVRRGSVEMKEPYTGVSPFENGEVASDIARYLLESEQTQSALGAGVSLNPEGHVLGSGGFLIQKMGGVEVDESELQKIEKQVKDFGSISQPIAEGLKSKEILEKILNPLSFTILEEKDLFFDCTCNRKRMSQYVAALGEKDVREIHAKTGKLEVKCHYCAAQYQYHLEDILDQITNKLTN